MSSASSFMPGILKRFGKKHVEIATQWVGSGMAYGTTAGVAIVYATDWKLLLQYLPFYNGKFVEDE